MQTSLPACLRWFITCGGSQPDDQHVEQRKQKEENNINHIWQQVSAVAVSSVIAILRWRSLVFLQPAIQLKLASLAKVLLARQSRTNPALHDQLTQNRIRCRLRPRSGMPHVTAPNWGSLQYIRAHCQPLPKRTRGTSKMLQHQIRATPPPVETSGHRPRSDASAGPQRRVMNETGKQRNWSLKLK